MADSRLQETREAILARVDSHPVGRFLRAFLWEVGEDDVFGMAAEMAYRFLFAVFPLLLFLVAALGFAGEALGIDHLFADLLRYAGHLLPAQVIEVVDEYGMSLLETRSTAFLTVGLVGTLWGAAGGVGTLIKGLNRAYDVQRPRPFWRRQLLAIAATLTVPPAALALLALAILGRGLAGWLGLWLGLERELIEAAALARWPVLVLLLLLGLSLVYHVLPNTRHRYLWSLPGSVVATGGWLLLSAAFRLYLESLGSYDATYGSFGMAMVFLLWLYLVGVVVLLGAELNALLEPTRRREWTYPGGHARARRE